MKPFLPLLDQTRPDRNRLGFPAGLRLAFWLLLAIGAWPLGLAGASAPPLLAGVAKVNISDTEVGPINDPLYAKALVIKKGESTVVIVTLDVVAIGEIGTIGNDYLSKVRAQLQAELGIDPKNVLINASHCHGRVRRDVDQLTVQAVRAAWQNLVPVNVGAGVGHEDRIMENRRLKLKSGREADVRHAYSLPPDEEVAGVGPVDPQIGILRLDRQAGGTLAVVYNFACHPIQGVPSKGDRGNTADFPGFASKVIEDTLGEGSMAFFLQGCGGDINPFQYKDVSNPRSAEPWGNLLGLSTMQAVRKIPTQPRSELKVINETLQLPRADLRELIASLQGELTKLVESLRGTSLNLKTFMPLVMRYNLHREYPSYYSHRYLHEQAMGRSELAELDGENRANMERYLQNIYTMERLTRLQTNLALLKKHQRKKEEAGRDTIDVEIVGMRIGDFVLVSFPGELSVEIGLNIKRASPHRFTFVTGCTNGYIYYAPTSEQLKNRGGAQEDSDCLLATEWQAIYEKKALSILSRL